MLRLPFVASSSSQMGETFGDFVEPVSADCCLSILMSPEASRHWANNGLSAEYVADYVKVLLSADGDEAGETTAATRDAVSYVTNELLENAMKYSDTNSHHPVTVTMQLATGKVLIYVTNATPKASLQRFRNLIRKLLSEDPTELYMAQITRNAENPTSGGSGLGYFSILSDYDAELAWRFQSSPDEPATVEVTTMVELAA